MNFAHPRILWVGLLAVALLALFFWWAWRKKQSLIRQFVQSRLLAQLTSGVSVPMQKLRMVLLGVAVALLFLALARPQWGFAWEEASQRGRDIVVAIDTSRSMLAEDMAPNRLTRAKLAALDLLKLAKQDRLGLVAFAGSAFLQCPLTLDEEAFRQSVNIVDVGIIPEGGTAISEAIDATLGAFKANEGDNHRVLVLFTDGEDNEEGVMDAVKKAEKAGLRIFTIGVGTPAGELLRQRDEKGNLAYIKDDSGNAVKSKLNETLLQQIATTTGGFYLPLQGPKAMETLYQKGLGPLPTSELSSKLVRKYHERYQWPLALAMLCLIGELFVPDQKRPSRKAAAEPAPAKQLGQAAVAAAVLLLGMGAAQASPGKALKKYREGQYRDARLEYERLLEKTPNDPRLQFNAGTAAFQAKQYDQALKNFNAAVATPDLDLQQKAYYNLGNTAFRLGEAETAPDKKIETWEQAEKNYQSALKLNPADADSKFNADLVHKRLEELKQQQPKQKNQDKKDNQDKKEEDKDQDKDKDKQDKGDQKDQKQDQDNKDQQQDQKDQQDKKDQEQKQQNKQSQDQGEQKEDKKDQGAADKDKDKQKEQDKEQKASKSEGGNDDKSEAEEQEAKAMKLGQMTPAQAKQLLEGQKNEERALIYAPPKKTGKRRQLKDW